MASHFLFAASGTGAQSGFDTEDRCKSTLCVEAARCVVISGVPLCLCPDGFVGDGRQDGAGCNPVPGVWRHE